MNTQSKQEILNRVDKVSIFSNVIDTQGKPVFLSEVMDGIKNGKWAKQIIELRSIKDETAQKAFKNTLPCFTGSGVFKNRTTEELVAHSGVLIIDIDMKDNSILSEKFDEIRKTLIEDKYTSFLFTSCRGNGFAVGTKIDGAKHLETFLFRQHYYLEKHGLTIDKGCKDVTRLRFISYDPDLFSNEGAGTVIVPPDFMKETKCTPVYHANHEIMQSIIKNGKLLGNDTYESWLNIAFALAQEFGETGRGYFHELSKISPKYDPVDCDRKFDNCLKTNKGAVTFASIVHLAKKTGIVLGGVPSRTPAAKVDGLVGLIHAKDLLNEGEGEESDWLWDGVLPLGGFSVMTSKPKVGKSTEARQMALYIAKGLPFYDREVMQGAVIYLALEDKRAEIRKHLKAMGMTSDDPFYLYAGGAPVDAIKRITADIAAIKPVLLVIDTLFRLIRLKDGNSYNEVTNGLEPLIRLARDSGVSILGIHHAKKGDSDVEDCLLGSTAIFGSVDTTILLKRYEGYRTIQSRQRYGDDMPETVLLFDKMTGITNIGGDKVEQDINLMENEIFEFLSKQNEPIIEKAINEEIEGRTLLKRKALRMLLKHKKIARIGKGGKGDPYRYSCSLELACSELVPESGNNKNHQKNDQEKNACSLVPGYMREQQNKNHKTGYEPHGYGGDSCSHVPVSPELKKNEREQAFLEEIPDVEFVEEVKAHV